MKSILFVILFISACDGSAVPEAPEAGNIDQQPTPDSGSPTADAGPHFFAAQMEYQFAPAPSCTPPISVPSPQHCVVTNTKIPEIVRAQILVDYGGCLVSNYQGQLVTIDCTGDCKQINAPACGLQGLTVWSCPNPKDTHSYECAWFWY